MGLSFRSENNSHMTATQFTPGVFLQNSQTFGDIYFVPQICFLKHPGVNKIFTFIDYGCFSSSMGTNAPFFLLVFSVVVEIKNFFVCGENRASFWRIDAPAGEENWLFCER